MFVSLACDLASSDGYFSDEEKLVIDSYSAELGMEIDYSAINEDIYQVISELNTVCELREKKIIIFELIGLAMADSNYDGCERKIVREAMIEFGINVEFGDFCERKIDEYLSLQGELTNRILNES